MLFAGESERRLKAHTAVRSIEVARLKNDSTKARHLFFSCFVFEPERSCRENTRICQISAGRDVSENASFCIAETSAVVHSGVPYTASVYLSAAVRPEYRQWSAVKPEDVRQALTHQLGMLVWPWIMTEPSKKSPD